jgi:riboflavin-specific deaminase-like protein
VARPVVTLHFAQSLDGRIGLGRDNERAILSSDAGVTCAHDARRRHDAVLIGIETLLHDDPLLTARFAAGPQPLRIVLDSELRLPLSARLLQPDPNAGRVWAFGCVGRATPARRRALEAAGITVQLTSSDACGRVELNQVLEALGERGVERVLVEGGAKVLTSFLQAGLAQRAEIEIAPLWLGDHATPALGDLGVTALGRAVRLDEVKVEWLGASLLLCGDIVYPTRSSR